MSSPPAAPSALPPRGGAAGGPAEPDPRRPLDDHSPAASWRVRAAEIGAKPADAAEGAARLAELWGGGRLAGAFDAAAIARLAGYLQFARVGAGRRVIEQDELGDFMLVVLEGSLVIERTPRSPRAKDFLSKILQH